MTALSATVPAEDLAPTLQQLQMKDGVVLRKSPEKGNIRYVCMFKTKCYTCFFLVCIDFGHILILQNSKSLQTAFSTDSK